MLTDVSTEMVASVVPLYLLTRLDLSFTSFGALDATLQLTVVGVGLLVAVVADRTRRHRSVAFGGYLTSAGSKVAVVASAAMLPWMLVADRFGKGVRTAPRDALIAATAGPGAQGRAFGVHRALDTAGALLGPVLAFVLLSAWPGRYDVIWVAAAAIAVVGLVSFITLVEPVDGVRAPHRDGAIAARGTVTGLLAQRSFRMIAAVAFLGGVAGIGESFVLLVLRQRFTVSAAAFPLMLAGASVAYLLLALPIGRWSDRHDPLRMVVVGVAILPLTSAALLTDLTRFPTIVLALALLGASGAVLDAVMAVVVVRSVPRGVRAIALALVAASAAAGRWCGITTFGAVWDRSGRSAALGVAVALGGCCAMAVALLVHRTKRATRT
jgi:MFS family permease